MAPEEATLETREVRARAWRAGRGRLLVFLHGAAGVPPWNPFFDALAKHYDVLVPEHPGFGTTPSPAWLRNVGDMAMYYLDVLDNLKAERVHLVGNSLGGWIAFELARRGRARSVTALMPAGLWRPGRGSDGVRHRLLFGLWRLSTRIPGAGRAARNPALRTVALLGAFGRPWRVPADVAEADVANFRHGDLRRTMRATYGRRFTGGRGIDVPVTVVLGTRDPLIRRRDLDLSVVPAGLRLATLRGAGHVPTWDDPDAVAAFIASTAALPAVEG
jgi:pimeloyl-ACP methyl ester carboxylesterase